MVTYLLLTHWHWWGLAALFIIAELLSPCFYFLAWALAAGLTGLVALLLPGMPGLWQILMFIVLSALFLTLAYLLKQHRLKQRGINKPDTSQGD